MKSLTSSAFVFCALSFLALPARADVAPPETQPCVSKAAGDACTYNGAGTCQSQTCGRLDYANWDRDASASPPTTTYACLKCLTDTVTTTASNTATSTPTATSSSTATSSTTSTTTPTATASNTSTTTTTNTDTQTSKDDGFCSIGKQPAAKRIAPWLMAGAFSLLFLFGWRRRQR
jgi:hypothetical protein